MPLVVSPILSTQRFHHNGNDDFRLARHLDGQPSLRVDEITKSCSGRTCSKMVMGRQRSEKLADTRGNSCLARPSWPLSEEMALQLYKSLFDARGR